MRATFRYVAVGWGVCSIEGDDDIVRFESPVTERRPTREEWEAFWSLIDSLGAWDWRGDYGEHIVCGTPWSLKLERHERVMSCSGNGWKDDSAPAGFARLYQAMRALAEVSDRSQEAIQQFCQPPSNGALQPTGALRPRLNAGRWAAQQT